MGPNVHTSYEVKVSGPIFTGAIYGQMKQAIREIEDDLADETIDTVREIDRNTFRHPTGYATSRVRKERSGGVMTTSRGGLAYGPWLEDGGSRASLFSGYGAFAKTTRIVNDMVPGIVGAALERYVINA